MSHTIHVWYIYLHLVDFYDKCRYYIPCMDAMGVAKKNSPMDPTKKNLSHDGSMGRLYIYLDLLDWYGTLP